MTLRSSAFLGVALAAVVTTTGCTDEPVKLTHGFIKIDPTPLADPAVFNGTSVVLMSMEYQDCLRDFYAAQPDWTADGIDGFPVFAGRDEGGEGWLDRLCDEPDGLQAECEVESIEQHLDARALHVRMRVLQTNLEQYYLKFGPIPTSDLTDCTSVMSLTNNPVQGFDGSGTRIWDTESFVGDRRATPGQGGALRVRVKRI